MLPAEAVESILHKLHPVESMHLPPQLRLEGLASHSKHGLLDLRGLLSRTPYLSDLPQRDRDRITSLDVSFIPSKIPQAATAAPSFPVRMPELLSNLAPTTHLTLHDTDVTSDALHLLPTLLHTLSQGPHRLHTATVSQSSASTHVPTLTRRQRSKLCGAFLHALPCTHLRHLTLDLLPPLQPHLACADAWAPALSCMRSLTHLHLSVASSAPSSRPSKSGAQLPEALLFQCISPSTLPHLEHLALSITHAAYLSRFFALYTQHSNLRSLELGCAAGPGRGAARPCAAARITRGTRQFWCPHPSLPSPRRALHAAAFAALPQLTRVVFHTACGGAAPPQVDVNGRVLWTSLPLLLPEGSLAALEPCAAQVSTCELRLPASFPGATSWHRPTDAVTHARAATHSHAIGADGASTHTSIPREGEIVGVSVALRSEQLPLLATLSALTSLDLQLIESDVDRIAGVLHAAHAVETGYRAVDYQGVTVGLRGRERAGCHRNGGTGEEAGSSADEGSCSDEGVGAVSDGAWLPGACFSAHA